MQVSYELIRGVICAVIHKIIYAVAYAVLAYVVLFVDKQGNEHAVKYLCNKKIL